ncbi:MAG: hypothetical protein U1F77_11995 [Kiritimatiellia bacterium]
MMEPPFDSGAPAPRLSREPAQMLSSPSARRAIILLWHCTGVILSLWSAYLLRFDFAIPARFHHMMVTTLPLALVSYLAAYYHYGLFSGLWAYFGMNDLLRTAKAVFWGTGLFHGMVYVSLNFSFADKPRSIFPMMFVLVLLWEAGGRGVSRHFIMCSRKPAGPTNAMTTLLMAPVNEADLILRNAAAIESETGRIVGILTNEKDKVGLTLQGLPILGGVLRLHPRRAAGHLPLPHPPPYSSPYTLNQLVRTCADGCSLQHQDPAVDAGHRQRPGRGGRSPPRTSRTSCRANRTPSTAGRSANRSPARP